MKVKFLALAALVLGLASCQNDFSGYDDVNVARGEVDFELAVTTPDLGDTRAEDGDKQYALNSGFGAIDYLQDEAIANITDWTDVDLRYSLEVYEVTTDANGDKLVSDEPVKDRMVIVKDAYEPVKFNLRLIPNREYRFVVFADFVDQDATDVADIDVQSTLGLHHEIGATLRDIKVVNDGINDECTDAYFYAGNFTITNSNAQEVTLKRPYGKVRVIATDLAELNNNLMPAMVKVEYEEPHAAAFNAVTGGVDLTYETKVYTSVYNDGISLNSLENHFYNAGWDAEQTTTQNKEERNTHMTLFTDYILAEGQDMSEIHFTMSVYGDKQGNDLIKTTEFNTQIPIQRNHLTTIIGNVLTTATEINVTIDDNFENAKREYYVFEALVNGGEVTLDRDYVIGRPLFVEAEAVLNLNGHTIKNTADNQETDVIIVREGGKLTINGEGTIEAVSGTDGYAVVVRDNGELTINGGTFKAGKDANGEANAVVYVRDNGKVFVNGGYFPNDAKSTFVLNKRDADRANTVIEVRGGTFEYFDPMNNAAEGANTDFMADGFASYLEGEHTYVVRESQDYTYDEATNTYYVYNANGLATWAYVAANTTTSPNLEVMNNIKLPKKTIEPDDANKRYTFTGEDITVTDGIPSGSNWPAISDYETSLNPETGIYEYYGGVINGNGYTISGLRINHDLVASGFLCWTKGAKVDELTFDDAVVYNKGGNLGETYTGIIIGRCWHGSHVNNCHIKNSSVLGKNEVGGVVGRVYRRTIKTNTPDGQPQNLMEDLAYVTYCTTDENTTVKGQSSVGGIAGMNYGCIVGQCINNAQVSATSDYAGGIVGYHRSYTTKTDGYIIACKSTSKATIRSKYAGGIAGYVLHDKNHLYAKSWIVGCASESTISGTTNAGGIIGNANNATISSCWALQNGTTKLAGKGTSTNIASYMYSNATNATQADIDAMNAAIEAFNVSDHNISLDGTVGAVMLKRWVLVNGVPVLQ